MFLFFAMIKRNSICRERGKKRKMFAMKSERENCLQ
jgi:hypothetical protein